MRIPRSSLLLHITAENSCVVNVVVLLLHKRTDSSIQRDSNSAAFRVDVFSAKLQTDFINWQLLNGMQGMGYCKYPRTKTCW